MESKINVYEKDGVLIAVMKGEIDNYVTRAYREIIDTKILSNDLKYLVLDFKDVSFVDSSGIGFIIGRYNLMKKEKGNIVLSNINDVCQKIFNISGILRLISHYPTLKIAQKEVKNNESYRIKI